MTCLFREAKFLNGAAVNKTVVSAYFDQYAKDHPEWTKAVQHLKLDCLEDELKPQGAFLDCPAYDVMQCVITNFVKVCWVDLFPLLMIMLRIKVETIVM